MQWEHAHLMPIGQERCGSAERGWGGSLGCRLLTRARARDELVPLLFRSRRDRSGFFIPLAFLEQQRRARSLGHERPTGAGARDVPVCSSAAPCSAARGPERDAA